MQNWDSVIWKKNLKEDSKSPSNAFLTEILWATVFFSLATANGFWVWKKSKKFSINSTWLVIHWDDFQALADRVNTLMDHDQERKMDMKTWMLNNVLVVGFIKKVLGQPLDDHMIQRAIGLLKTNSVKLDAKPGYTTGSAIYPTFSYLNHNCVCNSRTKKYVDQNGVSLLKNIIVKKNCDFLPFRTVWLNCMQLCPLKKEKKLLRDTPHLN